MKGKGYLVGGRVRSLFTNEFVPTNADYDVVVVNTTYKELLKYLLNNNIEIKVPNIEYIEAILNDEFEYDKFFTKDNSNWTSYKTGVIKVGVKNTKSTADYVLARKAEQYEGSNLVPSGIIINDKVTLEEDISRRDFRINSLILPLYNLTDLNSYLPDELYDPYKGLTDILNKTIHCVGDPFIRFMEDPSRILRLLKFMLRLKYGCGEEIITCLSDKEDELIEAFITKMNPDRTANELKHIFNDRYNALDSIELFMKIIPKKLARVILSNELYLNPTIINPVKVKKQTKWR
jgi:tRNA nucleotidyltransferase/poly(A) polymerase